MKILGIVVVALAVLRAEPPRPNLPSFSALPTGCVLVAKTEVWLNVYQEDDQGNQGAVIFSDLHLNQGETQRVTGVRNNKIIYSSKALESDQYQGFVHSPCVDAGKIFVPQR
jgi:hypothetical protein